MKRFKGAILGNNDFFGYFVLQIAPIMERFPRVKKSTFKNTLDYQEQESKKCPVLLND